MACNYVACWWGMSGLEGWFKRVVLEMIDNEMWQIFWAKQFRRWYIKRIYSQGLSSFEAKGKLSTRANLFAQPFLFWGQTELPTACASQTPVNRANLFVRPFLSWGQRELPTACTNRMLVNRVNLCARYFLFWGQNEIPMACANQTPVKWANLSPRPFLIRQLDKGNSWQLKLVDHQTKLVDFSFSLYGTDQWHRFNSIRAVIYSILMIGLKDSQNNSSIVSMIGCNQWKVFIIYLDENKSIVMQWMAIALVWQRPKNKEREFFGILKSHCERGKHEVPVFSRHPCLSKTEKFFSQRPDHAQYFHGCARILMGVAGTHYSF